MIEDAIRQAQELAKKAQQATYTGRCTVSEYRKVKDPKTKITSEKSVAVLEDQACRLSYSSVSAVDQSDTAAKTAGHQTVFTGSGRNQSRGTDHRNTEWNHQSL